jgi:hypothetical protein
MIKSAASTGVFLALVLSSTYSVAAANTPWAAWEGGADRRCSSHHVPWVSDGGYSALVDAFEKTLLKYTISEIRRRSDFAHECAQETGGFGCEMGVTLSVYQLMGLLARFIRFGCKEVRCEEIALCSKFPGRQK